MRTCYSGTMLRFGVLLLVVAATAVPPVTKSRDEIEAFRSFLESGKSDSGFRIEDRQAANPHAKVWENSGKYQGDILLEAEQVQDMLEDFASGRNAYIWPNTKWPDNVVVYEFAEGHFTQAAQNAILNGIAAIERNSCVRFRLRNNNDRNYVRVTNFNDGCYAHVGYWSTRGVHILNLTWPSCSLHTTIVHEWLHILGFLHMQSTHNRDDYVRIMWENIWPGMEHNFDKYESNIVNNMGLPYEYASSMHYGGYGFSINGRPTMVALYDWHGQMGQQDYVSYWDYLRVRRHYNCPGAWSEDVQGEPQQPSAEPLTQEA
ncbi:hatching enzyme 1.2-like [Cydia splendana]|uniref:hatching enzyme 1.2-like n=1 Tax=Cydia splendana TaxID=1100963 RepID=UPI00300C21F9